MERLTPPIPIELLEFGLAARLSATVGVIDHGLFPPTIVTDVLVARGTEVEHIEIGSVRPAALLASRGI